MNNRKLSVLKRRWQADPGESQLLEDYARALRRSGLQPHYALIACIESNLEALQAVLADIDRKGIPDILCLGGMIGSGPNPVEVIDLVMKRCRICLDGWSDKLIMNMNFPNPLATVGEWLRDRLEPGFLSRPRRRLRWEFLNNRPIQYSEDGTLFAHGSPLAVWDEIRPKSAWIGYEDGQLPRLEEFFDLFETVLFTANTHIQGVLMSRYEKHVFQGVIPEFPDWGMQTLISAHYEHFTGAELNFHYEIKAKDPKLIINAGSVGQPQDKDNRAGYIERIGPHIFFHRIDYDFEKTIAKINLNKHIHERYGERLRLGI